MQSAALAISLLLILLVAAAFGWAVQNSTPKAETAAPAAALEPWRGRIFWALFLLGVLVAGGTLRAWPHAVASSPDAIVVNATGSQWFWELSRKEVPVGRPIVFRVGSNDVNHGLGIYDADGTLLFQTQSMPGYVNQVSYTFTKPGRYRALCMEYCGLVHHDMIAELRVVDK